MSELAGTAETAGTLPELFPVLTCEKVPAKFNLLQTGLSE
jgi:hypothetical protein